MSRIGSSSASGVRVVAQPISNIYTVLLMIGAIALIVTTVVLCVSLSRYGPGLSFGEPGPEPGPEKARDQHLRDAKAELEAVQKALGQWPEEAVGGTVPPARGPAPPGPAAEPVGK
ncbi:MAG TPA: hypothetical protein VM219_00035 [Phycisphaerae bacterium]|nr:hypothetical protein [Phycisphaerae bacterium]